MASKNVRNVVILLAIAAVIVVVPGGGRGARVVIQAISLVFLGAIAWVASRMYREHRVALYSLGDRRRTALYAAVAVGVVALTARPRLWSGTGGKVVWVALLAGAVYTVAAVIWSSRKYD